MSPGSSPRDAAGWQLGIDMRVVACAEVLVEKAPLRRRFAFAVIGSMTLGLAPALAFDGTTSNPSEKIPKNFTNPQQALRAGVDDLKAGDADASVAALTYAADGGQDLARWKLGQMYADGQGVQRDDVKAYHYFNELVEDYDEDQPDRRNSSAISNAFVAVGVYCLNGIPKSDVRPDPRRAHELFQYAATIFGDPNAQYNLAHMYLVGAGGVAKDNIAAVRWLAVAAQKGHAPVAGFARAYALHRRRRAASALPRFDVARGRQGRLGGCEGGLDPRAVPARFRAGERQRQAGGRGPA